MASVGDISVQISLDIADLRRNLNRVEQELQGIQREFRDTANVVDRETSNMAKALGGVFSTFAGTGLLAGLGGVVGDILSTTSEAQSSAEQYTQVMGKLAGDSDKYINEMSKAWNKHPSELKGAMMQYQAILKGKGVSEKEAFEMSKAILERTVDANAFANEDMAETTDRFMAMIKGEYDSLDTAMVNLSATMMNDKAQEVYGKKFDELSVTQQEQLKVQEALRQHTSAGVLGQGEREAESYANEVAKLSKTFDELKTALGSPIISSVSDILSGLSDTIKKVADWFGKLPKPVQEFAVVVSLVTVAVIGLTLALGGVALALGAIATAVGATVASVAGVIAVVVAVVAVVVGIVYLVFKYWDEIKAWTKKTWDSTLAYLKNLWSKIKASAIQIWTGLTNWFSEMLESVKTWFSETWTSIKETASSIWQSIIDTVSSIFKTLYEKLGIKTLVENVVGAFNFMKDTISITSEMIVAIVRAIWLKLVEYITPIVESIVTFVSNSWNSLKEKTVAIYNSVKDFLVGIWQKVVGFLKPIIASIVSFVTQKWNSVKTTTSNIYNSIKTTLSNIWNSILTKVKSVASSIYNSVKEKFTSAKKAITDPIKEAKKTISGYLEDIKGFFSNLKLKIPFPKVPKISVTKGTKEFLGQEIPYPKFNVSWNAKGNIFNGATLLGGGQGVGEAGAEAVLPIEHKRYMQPFSSSIAEHLNKMQGNEKGAEVVNNFNISQLVVREEADIERIASELERKQRKEQRAKGTFAFA